MSEKEKHVSLRDKIAAIKDIPEETLAVPEWGGLEILVRGMTAGDRGDLLASAVDPETGQVDLKSMYPDIVILTAHDPETGERIWMPEDRAAIQEKSGKAIDRLATVGMRLSGMDPDEKEKAGKGSSSTGSGDSSSSSPAT